MHCNLCNRDQGQRCVVTGEVQFVRKKIIGNKAVFIYCYLLVLSFLSFMHDTILSAFFSFHINTWLSFSAGTVKVWLDYGVCHGSVCLQLQYGSSGRLMINDTEGVDQSSSTMLLDYIRRLACGFAFNNEHSGFLRTIYWVKNTWHLEFDNLFNIAMLYQRSICLIMVIRNFTMVSHPFYLYSLLTDTHLLKHEKACSFGPICAYLEFLLASSFHYSQAFGIRTSIFFIVNVDPQSGWSTMYYYNNLYTVCW